MAAYDIIAQHAGGGPCAPGRPWHRPRRGLCASDAPASPRPRGRPGDGFGDQKPTSVSQRAERRFPALSGVAFLRPEKERRLPNWDTGNSTELTPMTAANLLPVKFPSLRATPIGGKPDTKKPQEHVFQPTTPN